MDTQILKKFGEQVRKLRKEKGMSQEQLADAAGIERSYMGTIERGERNPTLMKVYNIAKALKVSASTLLPF
ncbi:MAG: helix-turn-helix transcriptional regulator [Candidatus Levybacteria bacterium]|nr:helix-turn-helix transcriptional regulator [Candidatus Levybacteria bacterium]